MADLNHARRAFLDAARDAGLTMANTASGTRRWLFGDQLGPHFLDQPDQRVLLIEARSVLRRRPFHRQKAHLILSAMRHRALELGEQCTYLQTDTYSEALQQVDEPLSVCGPTSHAADRFVRTRGDVEVLPARGFVLSREEFRDWATGRERLRLEEFYRHVRREFDLLMDGAHPVSGRWNYDADNRERPPRVERLDVKRPYRPREDDIDAQVRADLDAWEQAGMIETVGRDGPRTFPVTRVEAQRALRDFVEHRLSVFGPYEDAMLSDDPTMAHSLLSAPLNLGLLDPLECVRSAEDAYRAGRSPLGSVEGYVRQVIGWREYVWHIYWHTSTDYRRRNALGARGQLPRWFTELDAAAVDAQCLSSVLAQVRDHGWVHHIPRLMVLANYGLQRGWSPQALTDWFHRSFVDGYDWVMLPNVVGMSQHADGGLMATKPYAAGGAYIDRMSNYCGDCVYHPKHRTGEDACPYTAGYWAFLHRNRTQLESNHRMRQPLKGLDRLNDLDGLLAQERERGSSSP